MMFPKFNAQKWIIWSLLAICVITVLIFVEIQQKSKVCEQIIIEIDKGTTQQLLLTDTDIEALITDSGNEPLLNKNFEDIDLYYLESRVKSNKLVENCQISHDLKGNLLVHVVLHCPIARLIHSGGATNTNGLYINDKGCFVPLSEHYTTRVVLLSGEYFNQLTGLTRPKDQALMQLLEFINKEPFWKAQITQLIVDKDGEILMIPQVGNHLINFGDASGLKAKFRKLNVFYKTILPAKGWNRYKKVSVKYRNQIVCE